MGAIPESHYRKVPIAKATAIPDKNGFYQLYKNHYWQVTDDDCIVFYIGSKGRYSTPQCNQTKETIEHFAKKGMYPWKTRAEFLKNVFVPHQCCDYV